MISLTASERSKLKEVLQTAFEDTANLRKEFARATAAKQAHPGDHQSAVLGTYAAILKEIIDERTAPRNTPPGIVAMPSLEQLKRKYGVDKK